MMLTLSGSRILMDGKAFGSMHLSIGFYSVKAGGLKMRLQHLSLDSFSLFSGHGFKLRKLAEITSESINIGGQLFTLRQSDEDGPSRMEIFGESDNKLAAVSSGNGTMELMLTPDPVVIAVFTFLLCVPRKRKGKYPDVPEYLGAIHASLLRRGRIFTRKLPMFPLSIFLVSIVLLNIPGFSNGPLSGIVAALLLSSLLFFIALMVYTVLHTNPEFNLDS